MPFLLSFVCIVIADLAQASDQDTITFWTTEVEKDRLKIQQGLSKEFHLKVGIRVHVVPVEENRLAERVTAAYAARSLPDVLFHPLEFTAGWAEAGILDLGAASEVVKSLGKKTFTSRALDLVRIRKHYTAVPVDGWGQLLLYRRDLFRERGLSPPDCWERILAAARALHHPPSLWGFEVATDPGQTYTQQSFEHLALSNGVRLADQGGHIHLDTARMVQVLEFYKRLAGFSPPGNLGWLNTRMDYLSGRAAMIMWSPFILDELSGLRKDQPVIPDMMRRQPGYLSRNTGFVGIIKGPGGAAQYGQINMLGITRDARKGAAKRWVEFILTGGYLRWLGMAAEGKLPLRRGTGDHPTCFVDGWMGLEFGGNIRARISRFYGMDVVTTILSGMAGFDRWGFPTRKGTLISKLYGTKIIPRILKRFLDGEYDARQAARLMEKKVKALE